MAFRFLTFKLPVPNVLTQKIFKREKIDYEKKIWNDSNYLWAAEIPISLPSELSFLKDGKEEKHEIVMRELSNIFQDLAGQWNYIIDSFIGWNKRNIESIVYEAEPLYYLLAHIDHEIDYIRHWFLQLERIREEGKITKKSIAEKNKKYLNWVEDKGLDLLIDEFSNPQVVDKALFRNYISKYFKYFLPLKTNQVNKIISHIKLYSVKGCTDHIIEPFEILLDQEKDKRIKFLKDLFRSLLSENMFTIEHEREEILDYYTHVIPNMEEEELNILYKKFHGYPILSSEMKKQREIDEEFDKKIGELVRKAKRTIELE